jgi:hypothetical protein
MVEREEITGTINAHQSSTAPISLFNSKYNGDYQERSASGKSGNKMYAQYLRSEKTGPRRHSASRSDASSKVDSVRATSYSSIDRRSRLLDTGDLGVGFAERLHLDS